MNQPLIPELDQLSDLDSLAEAYETEFGSPPFHLSHWDPSERTIRVLLKYLRLPQAPPAGPYIYAYDLDVTHPLLSHLGMAATNRSCIVVPNGTSAILFSAWWLKANDVRQVFVVCPSYFPVFYSCDLVGVKCQKVYMRREQGRWILPKEELLAALRRSSGNSAVWITNPVYCTGSYLTETDSRFANVLLGQGAFVVFDECIALSGHEAGRIIAPSERFLGLYSPHKAVCLNDVKFAALVFDQRYRRFFADWTDVLVGGISASGYIALSHFLGDSFLEFQSAFVAEMDSVHRDLKAIVGTKSGMIQIDDPSLGYFNTCYAPALQGTENDAAFLRRLVFNTGGIVIPGYRNHFDRTLGFSFRVNLARACPQLFATFRRMLDHLITAS